MTGFAGQTVWITGASSGIGRGLALAMAKEGASVIASGRNADALDEVVAQCPGSLALPFDTTDMDALPAIVARAEAHSGGIDMLVNNAGVAQQSFVHDTDPAVYRQLMDVNFFAPVRLTQLVLPAMRARRAGRIAFVTSLSGRFGSPTASGYCGAKFALTGFAEALRSEVAHEGISVVTIVPGFVRTAIAARALGPDGQPIGASVHGDRGITPDEAAAMIMAGLVAGVREIPAGRGREMALLDLARSDPDALATQMAALGAQISAQLGGDRT